MIDMRSFEAGFEPTAEARTDLHLLSVADNPVVMAAAQPFLDGRLLSNEEVRNQYRYFYRVLHEEGFPITPARAVIRMFEMCQRQFEAEQLDSTEQP